ncbi:MAG: alpha/beta hydrolase [Pseudohongiella sp.]|nr:alpha/beta hydrolase [Pseudohongiella sp.]
MTRRIGIGLASVLSLLLVGYIYESVAARVDAKTYPPPGLMVDIGAYRLHLNCIGTGSPTVIIEAGLGDWSTSWTGVAQAVAQTTRVCSYDRAGMGWSEAGPLPHDAKQTVRELHFLLQTTGVHGPYVMVGHSLGGLFVRVFALEFAPEVAGVVLIESMNPGQLAQSQRPPSDALPFSYQAALARFGVARLLVKLPWLAPALPVGMEAYYPRYIRPQSFQATANEMQGMPAAAAQAASLSSFGDLPLTVLSAAENRLPGWIEWQEELLQLSTQSEQVIAQSSGHNVQLDAPDIAAAVIMKMVERVRPNVVADTYCVPVNEVVDVESFMLLLNGSSFCHYRRGLWAEAE